MNKFFINHAWDIFDAANVIGGNVDTGFVVFKTDVENGKPTHTKLDNVDFAALKEEWDKMKVYDPDEDEMDGDETDRESQDAACEDWRNFEVENYKALAAAWVAKDKKAFQAIIDKA